jgi:hypothetical protein
MLFRKLSTACGVQIPITNHTKKNMFQSTSRFNCLALLALLLAAVPARASLWTFNLPNGAAAETAEGEGLRLRGAGKFDPDQHTAIGSGALTAYNVPAQMRGPILHGTWTVTGFEHFDSQGGQNKGAQGGTVQVTVSLDFGNGNVISNVTLTVVCPLDDDGAFDEEDDAITLTGASLGVEQYDHPAGGFTAIHLSKP